jgi:hypothetical protein
MSTSFIPHSDAAREKISRLFDEKPPVLVEVRFPNMATSSDWYLCEDEEEFDAILERVAPGVELHTASVWDVRNPSGNLVVTKH